MITEALLAAITEAVFSYLLEQADLEAKMRAWLKGDPQRLAFQLALTRAFSKFAQNYRQWTSSFFDGHFLHDRAAQLLARCLPPSDPPDPSELASAWADELGLKDEVRKQRIAEVMPAASVFLRSLQTELRVRDEFRPLFDSRALDTITDSTAQSAQALQALREDLSRALAEASKYQVTIKNGKGSVIGDSNLVIQYFTAGITTLPTDYATRIANFLSKYLGTEEQPVPFGGREADLSRLDRWLDDPETPPYLLLAAPAGRGKSTLLARWSERMLERADVDIVFIPISIRFGTNLSSVVFAALSARLAKLHDESLPTSFGISAEQWRGIVSNYLSRPLPSGRSLLLILDGVDEAADWELGSDLFPLQPPKGLRVVLSARYLADTADPNAWLERLEWMRPGLALALTLNPLDQAGVADALRSMSFPFDGLDTYVDVVSHLYRLSEGDPLLVGLYAEALRDHKDGASRLLPEDLPNIPPGLNGYFSRWWEDQRKLWGNKTPLREPTVQALLNLLACAFGPLSQDDILRLEPGLSSWTLQEDLQPLSRFVIGDGRQQGYVYSHFKLGAYFYEHLSESERQDIESRFLNWGAQTVAKLNKEQLRPERVPSYLSQFYSTHLFRAGAHDALFALVDDHAWYEAQQATDPSGAAYLTDLELAWSTAEAVNADAVGRGHTAPLLGREVRCALAIASLHSLSRSINSALLAALVVSGLWQPSQALSIASQNPDSAGRSRALQELAPYLPKTLMEKALAAARTITDADEKTGALTALAAELPELQRAAVLQEALAAARTIADASRKVEMLLWLAGELAEQQKSAVLQEALVIAHAIDDASGKTKALAVLAAELQEPQKSSVLQEALAAAQVINVSSDTQKKSWALVALVAVLPEQQKSAMSQEALAAVRTIDDTSDKVRALAALAAELREPQKSSILQEALSAARTCDDTYRLAMALEVLAPHLPEAWMGEALTMARTIDDAYRKSEVLAVLADTLAEPQRSAILQEALVTAQTIGDKGEKALAHSNLVFYLPEPQKNAVLQKVFTAPGVIEAASGIEEDEVGQIEVLVALATHLAEPKKTAVLQEALASVRVVERAFDHAYALAMLVPYLMEPQKGAALQEALVTAKSLQTEAEPADQIAAERAEVLALLVPQLTEPQKSVVLQEALAIARTINEEGISFIVTVSNDGVADISRTVPIFGRRSRPLAALADELPEPQKTAVLQEAFDSVRETWDQYKQAHALEALAPHLPEILVREALTVIQTVESEDWRSQVLEALLLRLAELGFPQDALDVARMIWGEAIPARVHTMLIHQEEPQQTSMQQGASTATQEIDDENEEDIINVTVTVNSLAIYSLLPLALVGQHKSLITLSADLPEPAQIAVAESVMVEMIHQLKETQVREALAAAQAFKSGTTWLQAKAALLLRLADLGYTQDALDAAHAIWGEKIPATASAMLMPYFKEPQHNAVIQEILTAAQTLQIDQESMTALKAIILQLSVLTSPLVYLLWQKVLRLQAADIRRELLSNLPALLPVFRALGTEEVWNETADAILDAARWWP